MKFYIKNFGCKLNQSEGDALRERLLVQNWQDAEWQSANVIFVNGCTVTSRADQKVRQFIHKIRRENPSAQIIVTGCTANAVFKDIPTMRQQFPNSGVSFAPLPEIYPDLSDFPTISGVGIPRVRAWVKIQDGCNRNCAYCIVPLVRGKSRSRKTESIIQEVNLLAQSGFKEVVLTGVDIGDWKNDEGKTLPNLLKKILKETNIPRIRLSSLEPPGLTSELTELIASEKRIAPHLHIPLQSASAKVLKTMNRESFCFNELLGKLQIIRSAREDFCLGTDIIVGFPTETEEDFRETIDFLETGIVSYAHIFTFSKRPGTPAWRLKPLPPETVNKRKRLIRSIDENNRKKFAEKFVGKPVTVLIETVLNTEEQKKYHPRLENGKRWLGHAPNYLRIIVIGDADRGEEITVLPYRADKMELIAKYKK